MQLETRLRGFTKRSTKDGGDYIEIKLELHPHDDLTTIMQAPLGSRWKVEMVELNDEETPKEKTEGEKAVQLAGILCGDRRFALWLSKVRDCSVIDAKEARDVLCKWCGIESRREFSDDLAARNCFLEIVDRYRADTGQATEVRG